MLSIWVGPKRERERPLDILLSFLPGVDGRHKSFMVWIRIVEIVLRTGIARATVVAI